MDLQKKKVLVVGMGRSGLSAARWLSEQGAEVVIGDIKERDKIDQECLKAALELGVKVETGAHREETFLHAEMIIVSPGVPHNIAPIEAAVKMGIPVIGEMELAARQFQTPIIAVTGTNGKSTAVSLLGEMIRASGAKVFVGGNIGTPLMDYVSGDRNADYVLVEVSSFQLDTMKEFCPVISLLLNISPDHLDRYTDYEAYVNSKLRIVMNQKAGQYAILNDDDKILRGFRPRGGVTVLRYGMEKGQERNAYIEGKSLLAGLPGDKLHHFDVGHFRLPGRHNLENLMGVVLAGLAAGLESGIIEAGIMSFRGLPHRMEFIGRVRGVDFYDDSKATNVDAALRSIESFDRQVILIVGGRHKGGDYMPLVLAAKDRVKRAVIMGESKELMSRAFKDTIPLILADDMEEAVSTAFREAEGNDVVLLAPACSSFDMFTDYAHRGRVFREQVERLRNAS